MTVKGRPVTALLRSVTRGISGVLRLLSLFISSQQSVPGYRYEHLQQQKVRSKGVIPDLARMPSIPESTTLKGMTRQASRDRAMANVFPRSRFFIPEKMFFVHFTLFFSISAFAFSVMSIISPSGPFVENGDLGESVSSLSPGKGHVILEVICKISFDREDGPDDILA